ncbi:uncharacterized protein LOC134746029 [Cydia strobilella]|uniref:uncharacterized protein LOC134746029 n=1 Tax=Cydia strobilella TaxID=1100964 RepID=UPI003003CC45
MRVQRALAGGIDRWAGRGAGRPGRASVRVGAASARSSLVQLRRAGVTPRPRAPGGGGEPRAARPRADAARPPRSRSAPCARPVPPGPRRARSLAPRTPRPRLRPVFLWARQQDGRVQAVHCEDYDPRNRIRLARTPSGWRVIPRTEIYNAIRVPPAPPRERKRSRAARKRAREPAWLAPPDLETHIPSHTIAVPRSAAPSPPPEPTPLDNLLAVAELEFNQQRGKDLEQLEVGVNDAYAFLPDEAVARDVMSFELGEPPKTTEDIFYDRKSHGEEDFQNNLVVHKDLFETISEAHYLPELSGPHDEALLESLVEKGCEDNQILGQALDKLAHLVTGGGDYAEEEEDMLLSGAPVADIIDRLEQSLESPGRSSITAAQGLLHLHHIGDQLHDIQPDQQTVDQTYMSDEVFVPEVSTLTLTQDRELQVANEITSMEYDQEAEKALGDAVEATVSMYTDISEPVIEEHETYKENSEVELPNPTLPEDSEIPVPTVITTDAEASKVDEPIEENEEDVPTCMPKEEVTQPEGPGEDSEKEPETESEDPSVCELVATDLSLKAVQKQKQVLSAVIETRNVEENVTVEKSEELPRDLSVHRRLPTPHASPRRIDIPRAPSRESDAMQSPQPSGIPAIPSSPEIFMAPQKSKQTLFLETLLSSPSPKMYTSEVTITKQQCEPLNLGKHRKSASPTVSSCSDEMRKFNKEFGEPQEKRIKNEMDLAKISKVFKGSKEDSKRSDKSTHKSNEDTSPLKQLQILKTTADFNIPDPLLVPKDKLNHILAAPGREIPALLIQRPELRLPEAFAYPSILQDPDILVISLSQLENILENDAKKISISKTKEPTMPEHIRMSTSDPPKPEVRSTTTPVPDQTAHPKPIQLDALATDIDAATTAALNQMFWLPYLNQLEVMAACSQNSEFLKAMSASGYSGQNYAELSQMLNASRFMGSGGFPMMPQMDYDNRMQFAMWQEAMNQANAAASRSKSEAQKEVPSKSADVQNPYVHSTKNHQSKSQSHSAARTSPIAHNYNNNQRSMAHNPFFQSMYPGMNPNIRPNMPLPGLQIPYFNPNMMGSQRSPRTSQQKSPTSPYYPNNNYLQSVKHSEATHQRSSSTGSQESPRPRISVKSLQNLLEPTAAAASGVTARRSSVPSSSMGRRRDEPEVGSTTPLGEPPPHPMPHPHDPSTYHLWHPLFGNQKGYNSPWSWTTVTATGD